MSSGRRKRKLNPPAEVAIKQEIEDVTETPSRRQKSGRSQGSSLLMKVKKEKDDDNSTKRKDVMPVTISPPDSRSGKEDGSLKMKFILSPKAEPSEEESEAEEREIAKKLSKNTPKEGTSKKNSGLKLKFSFKPTAEEEPKGKSKASRKRDSENVTSTDDVSVHPKKRFKTTFEAAMKADDKSGADSAKKKSKLTKLDSDSGYSDAQTNVQAALKPVKVDSPLPEKKNEIDKKKDKKKKRKEKDKKKKFFKTKSDKNRFLNVHRSSDEGEDGWIEERGLLKAPKAPNSSEYEIVSSWTNPVPEIPIKETQEVEIPMQPIKLKKDKKSKSRSKNKSKRKHGKKSKKFLHLEKKKKDKESFTQEQIIKIQQRLMLQGLKSPSSGGDDLGDLNFSSHGDDLISQLTASSGHFDPNSLLDESPTEEVPLKPVVIKSSDKKNDKSKLKEKAKKKKKPITAYMMWCKANRAKIVEQFPGLDFASYSRKLGELWHKLPEKEKTKWKHKQRSMLMKHKNVPALSRLKKQSRQRGVTKSRPKFKFPPPHTDPIDIAAHLKLLGESLGNVGRNLMTHAGGETEVHGSISVLMDSMLSAIGPLMCLTSQVEELNVVPQKTQASLLENIAYIMPGL